MSEDLEQFLIEVYTGKYIIVRKSMKLTSDREAWDVAMDMCSEQDRRLGVAGACTLEVRGTDGKIIDPPVGRSGEAR